MARITNSRGEDSTTIFRLAREKHLDTKIFIREEYASQGACLSIAEHCDLIELEGVVINAGLAHTVNANQVEAWEEISVTLVNREPALWITIKREEVIVSLHSFKKKRLTIRSYKNLGTAIVVVCNCLSTLKDNSYLTQLILT